MSAGFALAGVLFALLFAWQKPSRSLTFVSKAEQAEYRLKLSGPISLAAAGTIVAIANGLFDDRGLRVHLVGGSSDDDSLSVVGADENTIAIASAAGFLKARANGMPIIAFAAAYTVSPVQFFTLPSTTLFEPADLEGKQIGFIPDPDVSNILSEFISRNSLAQGKLRLVEVDTPWRALRDRKADVILGRFDVDGQELDRRNIEYKVLSPDSYGVHAPGPVYVANEKAFARRRELEKFLIATAEGWNAVYTDYNKTIPVIAKSIDITFSPQFISRFLDIQRRFLRPTGTRFGELDIRRIRVLQEQLLQRRVIQNPVDLTRAVKDDVVKEAYRNQTNVLNRIEP
ncbi:ABC transporter substrate-binding protein [Bradyrhizobium commune]|uniref:ABC transporter substrate-binding protein n=1 Tax=Bradyrhizobium commune TaxID=83627 RepID=A0A7S9D336_9BRAD|nr:ABC transporter substrate-binding protein [Bradyrhizobium commune]QPF90282.1 ABC transporter substrate-binding protein [Bradyrhizobium commune]